MSMKKIASGVLGVPALMVAVSLASTPARADLQFSCTNCVDGSLGGFTGFAPEPFSLVQGGTAVSGDTVLAVLVPDTGSPPGALSGAVSGSFQPLGAFTTGNLGTFVGSNLSPVVTGIEGIPDHAFSVYATDAALGVTETSFNVYALDIGSVNWATQTESIAGLKPGDYVVGFVNLAAAGQPANWDVTSNSGTLLVSQVPGPVVGAGLPGLIAACGGLIGLARRRRRRLA